MKEKKSYYDIRETVWLNVSVKYGKCHYVSKIEIWTDWWTHKMCLERNSRGIDKKNRTSWVLKGIKTIYRIKNALRHLEEGFRKNYFSLLKWPWFRSEKDLARGSQFHKLLELFHP